MGRFVGKLHTHDTPLATENNVGRIWECDCGKQLVCLRRISGRKITYGWYPSPIKVSKTESKNGAE
jgi:hypothetical protein